MAQTLKRLLMYHNVNEPDNSHSMRNERYGLVTWDIPVEFIKALDALFGLPD